MEQNYRQIQEGLTNYVYIGTIIFLVFAGLFVLFLIISMQKRKKILGEKQQLQFQYQQELLQAQLEIQEQTFKNISQEIHDNIGQTLSLAKLNLATADAEKKAETEQKIGDSYQLVSKAIRDLRDLSRSLNTDYVTEMGLLHSIEYELGMIHKTGIIKTEIKVEGQPVRFDKQKELIVFRIVQETLNNIIKHAVAKTITVKAIYNDTGLSLLIIDDGKGFDASSLNDPDNYHEENNTFGLGIRNMQNRTKLIEADLKINSKIDEGTEVTIFLPVEKINEVWKNKK